MSNEHVDKLRREAKIAIKGNDVPAPLAEFAEMKDLGVAAALTDAVRKQYNRPTPIQVRACCMRSCVRNLISIFCVDASHSCTIGEARPARRGANW